MGKWPLHTIGDFVTDNRISLQTGPFGAQLHAHDYLTTGVAVIPTEAIRDKKIDHAVLPKISQAKAYELSRHQLLEGDILFARRGVQATGRTAIITEKEVGFICGTGAIRLRVNAKNSPVDARFLAHVLSNDTSIAWFKFHAIGATMPNLNEGIIKSFAFRLPPKDEQLAIAELFTALDDKIELNRRMNETLEASARALFRDWFVDFGPTRAKAEGRPAYLAPDLWSLFPDRLGDGGVPEGWEWSTIGEEVEAVGGSTPSTKDVALWDGGIAWTTPKDLSDLGSPILLDTARTITDAGLRTISSGLLPAGTVLMSSRAPVGYLAIASVPLAVNQGYIAMKCTGRVSNWSAYLWAHENMGAIISNANGSTFQEISKKNFRPLPILVADDATLSAFDSLVGPMFESITANVIESRTLVATRDALLPKLMSGEIRVSSAEMNVIASL